MNWQKASIGRCAEPQGKKPARTAWAASFAALAVLAGCAGGPERPGSTDAVTGGDRATSGAPAWQKTRTWDDYRRQVARRVLAVNPKTTHEGQVEQPALAIPVLKVVLNEDGGIRRIDVVRRPSQAQETIQIAIDAVRRAGPFGPVGHLPRPWEFNETFLFNNDGRFKPLVLER